LLTTDEVLVAGGYEGSYYRATAELYNPATGTWTPTGSMATGRGSHRATLLPDGRVLVEGGFDAPGSIASAELYDPATAAWTSTGSLAEKRDGHTATLLPSGKVLVAAGKSNDRGLTSAELYDPTSGTWTTTGRLAEKRFYHTETLLADGKVLVAGGLVYPPDASLTSAELYDPATGTWSATASLANGRGSHRATLLPNGKVLVAGGLELKDFHPIASAELFTNGGVILASAASVKGRFDIDLPLTGPSGVEDRSGGPNNEYSVVMTFDQNIVSVESASSTCGTVQSTGIHSADAHKVTFNLVGVAHDCNGSTITITANRISDDQGNVLDSASVGLGLLLGDVNGDRVVNGNDVNRAQAHKGQETIQRNFRYDLNTDHYVTQSDIQLVLQQIGTSLP
jgi:hypothetical protein